MHPTRSSIIEYSLSHDHCTFFGTLKILISPRSLIDVEILKTVHIVLHTRTQLVFIYHFKQPFEST